MFAALLRVTVQDYSDLRSRAVICVCQTECGTGSGWMVNRISAGFNFYFNVDTMEQSWQLPESAELDPSLLTHSDIQV